MELREYDQCGTVAVPSLFVERSFLDRGFPAERLFRNPLGVNLGSFRPPEQAPSPPAALGLRVIYAGSLSVRKGLPDLLAGFRSAGLPDAQLLLIGGSTPELASMLQESGPGITSLEIGRAHV